MKSMRTSIRLALALLLLAAVFQFPIPAAQSAECIEGAIKNVPGAYCGCDFGTSTEKDRYKCIGGVWEYQFTFCGAPFCQG